MTTTFCYGCYLGPTQTSHSIKDLDRFQVAYVNQRHITEQKLLEAIVGVVNRYNRFRLPKLWGSGQRAAADGTKVGRLRTEPAQRIPYPLWRLGWNRLLPRLRHLHRPVQQFHCLRRLGSHPYPRRLAGKPVRDSPDTLHADTQGQSETVFGLAYLLAIQLMPRIRHWKHLTFYAPTEPCAGEHLEHIRELFRDTVDWTLIETHVPDMLRVALSISQGKVRSSTILRKLGTESRKHKLYVAFRELGSCGPDDLPPPLHE